jgi:hypothetical protein
MDYKYASEHFYTDVKAYEIVKVISDKTVEVRRLEATSSSQPHTGERP